MKKNRFLTFLFSWVPGCGLMYLGYMKKGLQIMIMFAASCYLAFAFAYSYYFGELNVLFLIIIPVIWFYQMFDSMHSLTHMRRYEWDVPLDDKFFIPFTSFKPRALPALKNSKIVKAVGVILVLTGSYQLFFGLLNYMYNTAAPHIVQNIIVPLREYTIPAVISFALIVVGVKFLIGKPKNELALYDENDED